MVDEKKLRKIKMISCFLLIPGTVVGPESEYYEQLLLMAEIGSTFTDEKGVVKRVCEFIEEPVMGGINGDTGQSLSDLR